MKGIDVSRYNGWPFSNITATAYKESDFVIVKASQGSFYKYTDYFKKVADKVLKDKKLLGAYHYADGTDAIKEADYFVSVVKPYLGKILLVLDWQTSQGGGKNYSWENTTYAKKFMDRVYEKTGIKCLLYTGMMGISHCQNCYPTYKLWFAAYPTNLNSWTVPSWPSKYKTAPWPSYDIWQFTSSAGSLDRNTSKLTKSDWNKIITKEEKKEQKGQLDNLATNFKNYAGQVSNSGMDERGKYTGGAAGDQSGKEWCIRTWYSYPWKCVLRHPKKQVREKIAELHIKAAKNNKIGYDQGQRGTYWVQLQKVKYDPSKITTKCEADCSNGVIANTKATGHLLNISALKNLSASYTGNMRSGFKAAGFQVLTDSKYLTSSAYLVPGDILLSDGNHTCVNLGIGSKSGYTQLYDAAKKTTITAKKTTTTTTTTAKKTTTTTAKKTTTTTKKKGVVTANLLNVRKETKIKQGNNLTSYPTIKKGKEVTIEETIGSGSNKWYLVSITGSKGTKRGYVKAEYIKIK